MQGQLPRYTRAHAQLPRALATPPAALTRHRHVCGASATATSATSQSEAKKALLDAIAPTQRGSKADREMRGRIEELQIALESHQSDSDHDWSSLLEGLWELQYTTAVDVLPVIEADTRLKLPFGGPSAVSVGRIFQRFGAPVDGSGSVENIIDFSVPFVLEQGRGVRLTVNAKYDVRSGHRLRLEFESANIGGVRISPGLEALIAPAILPRGSLQHAVLLALRQFNLTIPLQTPSRVTRTGGGTFLITYLDQDLLVGRAAPGIFILKRVRE